MNVLFRLLVIVSAALIPLLAIQVYNEIEARQIRDEVGRTDVLRLARGVASEQKQAVEGARSLLTALAATQSAQNLDSEQCKSLFSTMRQSDPRYVALASFDLTGRPLCADGDLGAYPNVAKRDFFRLVLQGRGLVIGGYDPAGQSPIGQSLTRSFQIAEPFYDRSGRIAGVVMASIGLDWLDAQLQQLQLPPSGTASIVDRDGTIIARRPQADRFVGQKIPEGSHAYMLSGGEGVRDSLGFDGISRIYAYAPLPGGPAGLVASIGVEKGDFMASEIAANRRGVLAICGSVVLALILGWISARAFVRRPVAALLEAADRWRAGNLGARVALGGGNSEFDRLGSAFNALAEVVASREGELERRVAERTRALEEAMQAQHEAQAALRRVQKMETVGRLIGGVAHDFNNLLAAIVGNIELVKLKLGEGHPLAPRLDAALLGAERGARLTQHLLASARRQHLRPQLVDLNAYVRSMQDILQRLVRSDVVVETDLDPTVRPTLVDPDQLEAAVLNLVLNARDAMPKGGMLRLQTRNVAFDGKAHDEDLAGDFVALTLADTGAGIPPEHLDKVFEPFFTTKEIGHGSGLGLSMVEGFLRQSGGAVDIHSVVGKGTAVTLYFPVAGATGPEEKTEEKTGPKTGMEKILLVDDDEHVARPTRDLLVELGYSVMLADSGEQALTMLADAGPAAIDILITDVVMPGPLSGPDLAQAILQRLPDLPVIYITGHSEAVSDIGDGQVLLKPFRRGALADAVRHALAARHIKPPAYGSPMQDQIETACHC
jgi:signal transduction histidine kinase/CheY-like chemotaxis protein